MIDLSNDPNFEVEVRTSRKDTKSIITKEEFCKIGFDFRPSKSTPNMLLFENKLGETIRHYPVEHSKKNFINIYGRLGNSRLHSCEIKSVKDIIWLLENLKIHYTKTL